MKRKQRRFVSLLLIFAMILSMMPATAFASEGEGIEGISSVLAVISISIWASHQINT